MNYLSRRKALIREKLSSLQTEISSLRHKFRTNRDRVDEYCYSRFHEELSNLKAKKLSIHNLIVGVLASNAHKRDVDSHYPSESKSLIHQLNSVEIEFQSVLSSLTPKNPLEHTGDLIRSVEHDLETNFCLLRRIKCNLPYHQNWMQFLTSLTQRDREAAFNYYKVALKEVRLRGRCISSIHRLLALLSKEKPAEHKLMSTVQHLTISNTTCERLCYGLWLRLLEMIIFLERFMSQKAIDKSTISALHHLRSWQEELSDGGCRIWKMSNEIDPLTERTKNEMWYSCLNDRLFLETLETKAQSPGNPSPQHVSFENHQEFAKSFEKTVKPLVPEELNLDLFHSNMSNGLTSKDHSQNSALVSDDPEVRTDIAIKRVENDSVSKPPDVTCLSVRAQNYPLVALTADESRKNFRSPASISHSEARKVIAEMSTGSDIIKTPSSELIVHGSTINNSNTKRLGSYMAAAEAAERFAAQQRSNSFVDISTSVIRKSFSDDHLLKATLARTRSLDDLNDPQTDRTLSLSHSPDDTTAYPFDTSEHLMSAWDNYQVPYYPIIERMDPSELKTKFPEALLWEDLFLDGAEALDFEQNLHQPQGTTRQIDEWSFEGLSSTPLSSLKANEMADTNDEINESSQVLLDPFPEDGPGSLFHSSERYDKCLQTEAKELDDTLTPSAFLNNSHGALSHEMNTTHTSGYESGPDPVTLLFQRSPSCSFNNSNDANKEKPSTSLTSRDFGIQTARNGHCDATYSIKEESAESTFLFDRVDPDFISRSEQDMMELREFLHEILVSSNSSEDSSPANMLVGDKQQRKKYSEAFTGPRSVYNLMKCFSCMLESVERNSRFLQESGCLDPKHREDLFDRWNMLAKWISSHTKELKELNDFREKIQELSAKLYVLNQHADSQSQNTYMKSQTLANESQILAEDAEHLRLVILNQRLQMHNALNSVSPNSPELFNLDDLFFECRNKILDRTLQDARSLTDQTNALKSKFSYLGALSERLQTAVPTEKEGFLKGEHESNNHLHPDMLSKLLSVHSWDDNHRMRCINRILFPIFAFVVVLVLLYTFDLLPNLEQYFPFLCKRNEWPGYRVIRIHKIGVPPQ